MRGSLRRRGAGRGLHEAGARTRRALRRAVVAVALVSFGAVALAQPDLKDPWGAGSGSSADPGSGSTTDPGTGSAGSSADPGTGSGSSPGTGSATDPGTGSGSNGTGGGSAGGGSAGSGSAGGGSAGSGSGSGSGPRIIQVPTDLNAPNVNAAASPTEVRLGGKFTVFVTATFNVGVEVNLREPLDLGPAFEVTRRLSEDKPTGDGRTVREWQLEVIAWELGDLKVPPIAVTFTYGGKADQVMTNASNLRVTGVLGDVIDDPKTMRGDAAPTDLLSRDWFWLYVAIGSVVGLGLLITLIAYLRSRRRRVALVGGVIAVPRKFDTAGDRALHKLKEIEASGILERDDDRKRGYAEMVEVIREYIGSRYRVATLDLTTLELITKIAKLASETEQELILRWLERCDIVKYGGLVATALDATKTLEEARALVVTTTTMPLVSKPVPKVDEPPAHTPAPRPVASNRSPYAPPDPSEDEATTRFDKSSGPGPEKQEDVT